MLKKLYDTNKILFAVLWIVAYCLILSVSDAASAAIGIEKLLSLPCALVLVLVLFFFLKRHRLLPRYGLCRPAVSAHHMLYYLPLLFLLTANVWNGVTVNGTTAVVILHILTMFCVGFLEEVIFRGLLFQAMRDDTPTLAVIVSSVTFGIGHIINLVNGSGAQLIPNLLQVVYATAAGFMFVMIYLKTDSLLVCIFTHGLFNALSVFAVEPQTLQRQLLSSVALTVISGTYAAYLAWTRKKLRLTE